jgi:hypothetical protein
MSATSKGSSTAAFTVRRKQQFRLPAQTERKLQRGVCSRKLKVKTEGQESAWNTPHLTEAINMSSATEFTIQMEDQPGTLGEFCRALADRDVNIIGFQSNPGSQGRSLLHMVTDNRTATKAVLENGRLNFTETEVAQVNLSNRVGALAKVSSRLGDAGINIDYSYCGIEPTTKAPLLFLGVAEVGKAMKILDQAAKAVGAGVT